LPVFIEAKDDGGGGNNWTTGATSRAKLQSNHHHQQTNIQFFLQAECPSCHPTNSVKAPKGKLSHSMDLLTPSSPGRLPTLSLTTNSSWLPCCHASHQPSDASIPSIINNNNKHLFQNVNVNKSYSCKENELHNCKITISNAHLTCKKSKQLYFVDS